MLRKQNLYLKKMLRAIVLIRFANGFKPKTCSVDPYVLGIDVGIQLIGIANFRSGKVWYWFIQNEAAKMGLERAKI